MAQRWIQAVGSVMVAAVVAAAAVGLSGVRARAGCANPAAGNPPQCVEQGVLVNIPTRVGIQLSDASLTIDPSSQPSNEPEYPWPTDKSQAFYGPAAGGNRKTFTIKIFSNRAGTTTVSASVSGGPASVPPSDWYFAHATTADGLPARPLYDDPADGWTSLGSNVVVITHPGKTSGWKTYYADIVVKFTGDEEDDDGDSATITYTINVQ